MTAFYNEHDPKAAAWLRELIKAGVIAPGVVDERSIVDISAEDVREFTQCHWFAGIGVWSYSLRQAGWRDDQRVWTASLPCQPFSAAGKQKGFEDERHLWPVFEQLVAQSDVPACFGEQVASKAVDDWLDVVLAQMEALGFTVGSVAFPAAGVGAPHLRDRTYWAAAKPGALAHAESRRVTRGVRAYGPAERHEGQTGGCSADSGLAVAGGERCEGQRLHVREGEPRQHLFEARWSGEANGLADADYAGLERRVGVLECAPERASGAGSVVDSAPAAGPVNGPWRDADWVFCRDGKWRPTRPGTQPLASKSPARVVRLRGYGNGLCAEAAKVWVETCLEVSAEV